MQAHHAGHDPSALGLWEHCPAFQAAVTEQGALRLLQAALTLLPPSLASPHKTPLMRKDVLR